MNVVIAVASCVEYAPVALPRCLDSLRVAGCAPSDIRVFGLSRDYNGQDLNPMIEIGMEIGTKPDWFFIIGDVCVAEPGFLESVEKCLKIATSGNHDVVGLRSDIVISGMGLFSRRYLKAHVPTFMSYCGMNKRQRVEFEISGQLSRRAENYGCFPCDEQWLGKVDFYNTGRPRWLRYFPEMHLFRLTAYRSMDELGNIVECCI